MASVSMTRSEYENAEATKVHMEVRYFSAHPHLPTSTHTHTHQKESQHYTPESELQTERQH